MNAPITPMASVEEKVRERIKATFLDLIPPELWEGMVKKQLAEFTEKDLPNLVKKCAEEQLREIIQAEFRKPEWQEKWMPDGGPQVSEMLAQVLARVAPQLVEAMFGGVAQSIVNSIRNGALRTY